MVVLGLLVLVVAGVVTAGMVLQNTDASMASVFGQAVNGTTGGLFLAGVITGAVALLGLMLLLAGVTRRRARRAGLKRQVREARGERESLAEENARLKGELARQSDPATYPGADADETVAAGGAGRGKHGLFHR